jgi:hypothetical protein
MIVSKSWIRHLLTKVPKKSEITAIFAQQTTTE